MFIFDNKIGCVFQQTHEKFNLPRTNQRLSINLFTFICPNTFNVSSSSFGTFSYQSPLNIIHQIFKYTAILFLVRFLKNPTPSIWRDASIKIFYLKWIHRFWFALILSSRKGLLCCFPLGWKGEMNKLDPCWFLSILITLLLKVCITPANLSNYLIKWPNLSS